MVITILESKVPTEKWAELQAAFEHGTRNLPPQIIQSYLNQGLSEPSIWQIVTVWYSGEDLEEYRKSVETPGGVLMFRSAGAEPTLSVFNVRVHAKGIS